VKHIHFIGIGGTGLSAIARVLLESGYTVSGSDRLLSTLTRDLAAAGAELYSGHDPANITGADLVVRSSAVPDDNLEVQAARAAGIPVLKRSEFLGQILAAKDTIAVAGTHGKTTTTAMTAWVLQRIGQDPSYIIGGVSKNLHNNAHAGRGRLFVIEADEYDRMFLGLQPRFIILTNLEHDHPDCFPTPQEYRQAFAAFIHLLQPGGTLFLCADDPGAAALAGEAPSGAHVQTYGLAPGAAYHAVDLHPIPGGGFSFQVCYRDQMLTQVSLQVPGEHNVRNALAVLAAVHTLGLSLTAAAQALAEFSGTGRRFDVQGDAWGVTVIDDYAHHPTEIRATLTAARSRYPTRRLWAVWQPHTYSRTRTLQTEFIHSFDSADRIIVTEVYAAREKNPGYSAVQLVAQMPAGRTRFAASLDAAVEQLLEQLQPGDVLIVLSAGDADQISARVLSQLIQREAPHA